MKYESLVKLFYKNKDEYEKKYKVRIQNDETAYKLPFEVNDNSTFVVISKEILEYISRIYIKNNKLSRLYEELKHMSTINKLISSKYAKESIVDEIINSNEIEGVHSSRKDIVLAIKPETDEINLKSKFAGVFEKYNRILQNEKVELVSSQNIRNLYNDIVLFDIANEDKPDGKIFRKDSTSVYSASQKELHTGINNEARLINYMDSVLNWYNTTDVIHLVKVAVFHYFMGYMHPFYDGNGRLSRYISSYQLKETLNHLVSFKISNAIKTNKKEYYDGFMTLNDFRNKGDLTPFVLMFLKIILETVNNLIDELGDINQKISYYYEKINTLNNSTERIILKFLVHNDILSPSYGISLNILSDVIGLSKSWTNTKIKKLMDKGYVDRLKIGKVYVYTANLEEISNIQDTQ